MTKPKTLDLAALKKTPPQVVDVRLSAEGLAEVELLLGNRKIIVSEADGLSDYKLGQAINQIIENPLPDAIAQNIVLNIYPQLAACSYGDLPTPEQFQRMGKEAVRLWIEKARELNPHEKINGESWWAFFESIEKMEAENANGGGALEDIKKKEPD